MSTSPRARRLITITAWLVGFHVLLAYGLPEGVFIGSVLVLALAYWRIGAVGAVFTSVMLVALTVFYGLALKVTGLDERIYYRPDERYASFDYARNHRVFAPNIDVVAQMPHGDLRALTTTEIAEPRRIAFRTDAAGFRNDRDYRGQRYVLVGDSFVAGTGNSHEQVLVSQLRADHGVDAYSLAYNGGDLADYAAYLRGFRARHGDDARALLFLFEGNDFETTRVRNAGWLARSGKRYYRLFADFNTYRVTMTLWKRFTRTPAAEGSGVDIMSLAGKPVAFYKPYVAVTERARLDEVAGFESVLESMRPFIDRVYFIPTKYRVYHRQVAPGTALPNAQWDYLHGLCRKHALPCTNLTGPLTRAADAALKDGELLWWRDDTHWNRAGIKVAARVVAADLKTPGSGR